MRARNPLLALALAAGSLAPADTLAKPKAASTDRALPEGGPPPRLRLPSPARFQLSSGPTVLVVERHELPMVSLAIVWKAGVGDELPAEAGVASLSANLLDEGTAHHGSLALAEAVDALGAHLATFSNWDLTGVSLQTIKRNLAPSLALLAEVVSEPAFDDKELERVRAETLTALLQRRDQAHVLASDVFAKTLYGPSHRYGLPAMGTEDTLKRLGRAEVVAWYQRHLRPELATVIVAGDLTVDEARQLLEKSFAAWKVTEPATPESRAAVELPRARKVIVDKPGAPQSEVRLGLPSVPRNSPDYFPLLVMNEILGGGEFSNRLNLNLREAHGYTYGAHSALAFRRDGGPFVAAAATQTAVTGPAVMEAFSEILRIRSALVEPRELRLAKDGLQRALARRFATVSDVTGELAAQVIYDLPADFFATFAKKVEDVSADQVKAVADKYLDPRNLSIVLVGDRKALAPQLAELPLGVFEEIDASGRTAVVKAATPQPPARKPSTPHK